MFNVKGEDLLYLDHPNTRLRPEDRGRYARARPAGRAVRRRARLGPARGGRPPARPTSTAARRRPSLLLDIHEFCARGTAALPLRRRRGRPPAVHDRRRTTSMAQLCARRGATATGACVSTVPMRTARDELSSRRLMRRQLGRLNAATMGRPRHRRAPSTRSSAASRRRRAHRALWSAANCRRRRRHRSHRDRAGHGRRHPQPQRPRPALRRGRGLRRRSTTRRRAGTATPAASSSCSTSSTSTRRARARARSRRCCSTSPSAAVRSASSSSAPADGERGRAARRRELGDARGRPAGRRRGGRGEYGFLPPSQRQRATILKPGTMIVSQPSCRCRRARVPVPGVGDASRPRRPQRRPPPRQPDDPFEGLHAMKFLHTCRLARRPHIARRSGPR